MDASAISVLAMMHLTFHMVDIRRSEPDSTTNAPFKWLQKFALVGMEVLNAHGGISVRWLAVFRTMAQLLNQ